MRSLLSNCETHTQTIIIVNNNYAGIISMSDPTISPLWPAESAAVTAHISALQGIIARLANNSASCKTWCLTLVAALLSLAGASHTSQMVTAALVPVIVFGFLDIMYLATEKSYRDLYNRVIAQLHSRSYNLTNTFEASATWDIPSLRWALGSWSIFPYYILVGCYVLALLFSWPAVLAK